MTHRREPSRVSKYRFLELPVGDDRPLVLPKIGTASVAVEAFRNDGSRWNSGAIEATCSGVSDTTGLSD